MARRDVAAEQEAGKDAAAELAEAAEKAQAAEAAEAVKKTVPVKPAAPAAPAVKLINIKDGVRCRQCAEADLPYFEQRGFVRA